MNNVNVKRWRKKWLKIKHFRYFVTLWCSFFARKPYRSMSYKETQSIEIDTAKEIFAVLIFKEEVLNKRSFTHFCWYNLLIWLWNQRCRNGTSNEISHLGSGLKNRWWCMSCTINGIKLHFLNGRNQKIDTTKEFVLSSSSPSSALC